MSSDTSDSKKRINNETINAIKRYIEIDDELKRLKEEIKKLNNQKIVFESKILEYLNSANETIINTTNSKLKKGTTKSKSAIKPKQIIEILNKYIKDSHIVTTISEKINDTIVIKEKTVLSRIKTH